MIRSTYIAKSTDCGMWIKYGQNVRLETIQCTADTASSRGTTNSATNHIGHSHISPV